MLLVNDKSAAVAAALRCILLALTIGFGACIPRGRNVSVAEQRLIWDDCAECNLKPGHISQVTLNEQRLFQQAFAFAHGQRQHCCGQKDCESVRRPNDPRLCLFCLMHCLAGASHSDICGISIPSFC